jgi:D-glycero-D-manno-heptose 1,7-bisphosphate phosphatase
VRNGVVRTVFLDRDGTINRKAPDGQYITSPGSLALLPGADRAVRRLNDAGVKVIVVTNQRGVSLGHMDESDLERIHMALQEMLGRAGAHVDRFYTCTHDIGACACRKPAPGLLLAALDDDPVIASAPYVMIGDQPSDIEAGRSAGAATILLQPGMPVPASHGADHRAADLDEAVGLVLQ